ncbi:LysR family transcriptional regulator [Bradyrhizobium sp. Ash2021]|uniref:LysR family transcriptional regulator n=1 Tax=unclassified Bradyrhizobium TaxID=2631580 RepID=UPI0028150BBC|nr:LysR family transcriptional regulator [Bradyrhizobium sp. Ash2021]WMT76403.1 LysR family transcriptional regulator [Bradyrhizobium sp. Ash2021]
MLDAVSLDQLRTFIAAVDEGSFSAASRKLLRAQSVVSETIGKLEEQIGVQLFDRSGRYPKLTPAGLAMLGDARSIITGVDLLKARAKGMSAGLEPELSVVIDVFYPIDAITQVAKEFRQKYPAVPLRIYVEALGGAITPVLDGRCSIGVIGSLPAIPDTLTYERLPGIAFLMVAARDHALASHRGKISKEALGKHTQIVLTDRSELSLGREFGVMSSSTWRLADLFAKHHFLLNGLGWGGMPLHVVRKDLEEGRLSVLPIEDVPPDGLILTMSVVWQTKSPPGPAGRWFVDRLKQIPVDTGKVPKPQASTRKVRRSGRT